MARPQRIMLAAADSIWSAAVIDLGVHFVGALRGDQIGNLADRFDVGLFKEALLEIAEAVRVGIAVLRRARGRRSRDTCCRRCSADRPC